MRRSEFLMSLDELFELDPGTLKGEEDLDGIGWDSVRAIEFIVLVNEKVDLEVAPGSLSKAATINDLVALLGDKVDP